MRRDPRTGVEELLSIIFLIFFFSLEFGVVSFGLEFELGLVLGRSETKTKE